MSDERQIVVIVGLTIREAENLALERREQDRGKHVIICSPSNPRLEGLRNAEYVISGRAARHPNYLRLHELVERNKVRDNYESSNGAK